MSAYQEYAAFNHLNRSLFLDPIFKKMKNQNHQNSDLLQDSFSKVEEQFPGFSQEFLMALLTRVGLDGEIDSSETFLRMASITDKRPADAICVKTANFENLEMRAIDLKDALSTIPDEIVDRKRFLESIKLIAKCIKQFLDSITSVYCNLPGGSHKTSLELRKKEFVKYSKQFSDTLKVFFKNQDRVPVFNSANCLVHQCNLILLVSRECCE